MQKYRLIFLVFCIFLLSIWCRAETSTQVSPTHWSYHAMLELADCGLVPEYVKVSKDSLTRLEMAYYLKLAITRLENTEEKKIYISSLEVVNRLLKEYAPELRLLGINITDLTRLTPSVKIINKDEGYYDLDTVLSNFGKMELGKQKGLTIDQLQEPYYLMGEYYSPELLDNVFIFLPEDSLTAKDPPLLRAGDRWEIMYTNEANLQLYFLVLRGVFPIEFQKIDGFYLFPLRARRGSQNLDHIDLEQRVFNLLNKLSQNYEVSTLRQFKGVVPVPNMSSWDPLRSSTGLEIGDYLVSTKPEHIFSQRSFLGGALDANSSQDLDLFLDTENIPFTEGAKPPGRTQKSYGSIGGIASFDSWDSLLRSAAQDSEGDSSAGSALKLPVFELPWQNTQERSWLMMNLQLNTLPEEGSEENLILQF